MTNEGGKTCPVCTEEMDLTDLQLKPCKCGYEVCVWCWHHIMDMAEKDGTEGRCPACRTPYDKEKIVSMTASVEINSDRKPKQQKVKSKTYEGRKHLSNVRVVQRHLVYTMGIPASLADEDVLQRKEYFGQYGKVLKASLTRTSGGAIQFSTNNTCSVYITYSKEEEAVRCIQSVSGFVLQGQSLRACFGTTKYCHAWLRNMPCNNPECVYLHDVGSQEDSFTKDEIVSGCTRSRVQQITGLMINLGKTGSVLPPPVDDSYISGTALSKPISRSPSDTPSIQLKGSPPNSSTGNERSISLPAAASWGLRVSNGHQPTATSSCSDGTSKQKHEDYNGSVGFPSLVASATPPSMLHSDIGKKAWVTKDSRASQSSKEVVSSDYSKQYQYAVTDRQKIAADTPGEVIQDAASSDINSRDDHCIQGLPITGRSIENDPQSCLTYSEKSDNIGLNGEVPSVCSGLSLVGNDCYIGNEHSEATEPSTLVSDQLFRSLRNHGLHQSYPELARGNLSPVLPKEAVSDGAFASREPSNWGSGLQTQALQDTCGEDDLLALGEQNSNFSEVCHPLQLPSRSSSINISNSSNGHSWSSDYACGPSDPVSRDHRYAHTKSDDIMLPFTSSDAILSNGYTENNVRSSTGLEKTFEQSSLYSSAEKGKYPGRFDNNPVGFEKNNSVDMGENSIISNILSMDFDTWGESLASPHNFAKLLSETDEQIGGLKISSRKEQKSNQSRFSFARQVESADHGTDSHFSRNFGSTMSTNSASQVFQDNRDMHIDEFPSGLSSPFLEESDTFYSGNPNFPSNRFSASRAPVSAPPGFSVPSKVPPPGFSIHERMDKSFDSSSANHFLGSSSLLRNQYHAQPNNEITSIDDVELIDPAILAVGTGRPANGMNDFRLDIRSTPLQLGASETDPRIQLLRQQFLPPQQNYSYSNHIGDRYSPLADAYNSSSRFLDQSQYAQLPLQPRAERLSHGWSSWNESQRGNDLGAADFFKSERFGLNQYFPDYDNRNSRMPKPSDIYNRAFGM